MDELTRRRRQAELQRIDAWLLQCEREHPVQWWGIAIAGSLILLILAQLLRLALEAIGGIVARHI